MSKARGLADLGNVYNDGALSNRNLIINGAMNVAQRGTSETGFTTGGYYTCDRFKANNDTMGTHTLTQDADGPDGFASSYKIEVTTADASPAAADNLGFDYRFEGQDLQLLKKGLASTEPVTLSFWVKSSTTGTYNLEFDHYAGTRHIVASYTVDTAATWEYKTITFVGDTSGTIANSNAGAARLIWWLGAGTNFTSGTRATSWATTVNANKAVGNVNLADTIGNYFQITGVQLEVGDTATPFEHRSYGQELALCQRYYHRVQGNASDQTELGIGHAYGTSSTVIDYTYPTTMRSSPTITENGVECLTSGVTFTATSLNLTADPSIHKVGIGFGADAGNPFSTDRVCRARLTSSATAYLAFDAEL